MRFIHPKRWWNTILSIPDFIKYWLLPDRILLKWEFYHEHHSRLNLTNPQSIDEKLQWIKLYDRKPIYHTMIDKIACKQFVAEKIGKEYVVPLLGEWSRFEDIDFSSLPNSFVLKCNHDSGSYIIVPEKDKLDITTAYYKLNNALKRDYYHYDHKQWGYKGISPKIFAEEYLPKDLIEYQVFCNNGEPVFFLVRNDLGERENSGFCVCYSTDWQKRAYRTIDYPNITIQKPHNYSKMLMFARILAKDTLHLRVDYYETSDGKLFISELTFYSHGGNFCNFNEIGKDILSKSLHLPINR